MIALDAEHSTASIASENSSGYDVLYGEEEEYACTAASESSRAKSGQVTTPMCDSDPASPLLVLGFRARLESCRFLSRLPVLRESWTSYDTAQATEGPLLLRMWIAVPERRHTVPGHRRANDALVSWTRAATWRARGSGVGLEFHGEATCGAVVADVEESAAVLGVALGLADVLDFLQSDGGVDWWAACFDGVHERLDRMVTVGGWFTRSELFAGLADREANGQWSVRDRWAMTA